MSQFDEHLFGRIAVLSGFLTAERLQECLDIQRAANPSDRQPIGEILRSRGYLTEEQLERIRLDHPEWLRSWWLPVTSRAELERSMRSLMPTHSLCTVIHQQLNSSNPMRHAAVSS